MNVLPAHRFSPLPPSILSNPETSHLPPHSSLTKHSSTQSSTSVTLRTNLLLSSAAKSKPIDHTLNLFRLLPARDTVTWNTAISACLRHRRPYAAVHLFAEMLVSSSSTPDAITIRSVLKACSELNESELLLQLHGYVVKLQGMLSSSELSVLSTCLLNAFCECGSIELAQKLFGSIRHRDVITFTSMLAGFAEASRHVEAIRVFREMVESDQLVMNEHAYSCALHACAGIGSLLEGQQIHAHVMKSMMGSDLFVGTSLVDLYVKSDEMACATRAFWEISEPTVVSWNALLAGNLEGEEGLLLFDQMRQSGMSPDRVTFASVLRACKDGRLSIDRVQQMHGLVLKTMDVQSDVFVGSALFDAYVDHGCLNEAQRVLNEMGEKDDAAFNLAIQGYIRNGHGAEAVITFLEALQGGKEFREVTVTSLLTAIGLEHGKQLHAHVLKFGCSDDIVNESLLASFIRMYSENQCPQDAVRLFEQIDRPDLVSWTSLISRFSRIGEGRVALNLYVKMLGADLVEPPNHYTFSTLLHSCARLAGVEEGKQIHAQIIKSDFDVKYDTFVTSGLLTMYSKCGYIEEASRLFDQMPEQDLASWNAMISSLAQHGFAEKAIETFQKLVNHKDLEPNHITFLGVLSACSHCGMVEKGYQYFKSIKEPTMDHYACLVDMFGRAGRLKEAISFIEGMPFEANEHIWSSFLAACRLHRNIELGEYSAKQLLELNPKDPGTYIALANIYAAAGRREDMTAVRNQMKSQADRKRPGFSWLRVNGQQYVFFADDRSYQPK